MLSSTILFAGIVIGLSPTTENLPSSALSAAMVTLAALLASVDNITVVTHPNSGEKVSGVTVRVTSPDKEYCSCTPPPTMIVSARLIK